MEQKQGTNEIGQQGFQNGGRMAKHAAGMPILILNIVLTLLALIAVIYGQSFCFRSQPALQQRFRLVGLRDREETG